jgi:hypothetical protein
MRLRRLTMIFDASGAPRAPHAGLRPGIAVFQAGPRIVGTLFRAYNDDVAVASSIGLLL